MRRYIARNCFRIRIHYLKKGESKMQVYEATKKRIKELCRQKRMSEYMLIYKAGHAAFDRKKYFEWKKQKSWYRQY